MFLRIWQYRVRPDKADEFRSVYGASGDWAGLFRQAAGFQGTELLQSATEPDTYLTLDRWINAEAWAAFLQAHPDDYAALDLRCGAFTVEEMELGAFSVLAY